MPHAADFPEIDPWALLEAELLRCRGCNEPLTSERDSDAHIIPNALGGTLSPRGILYRSANQALNELADKPLISAFGVWPTLIDVPRDRYENPAVTFETTAGERIRQTADGKRTRLDHVYSVTDLEQGQALEIRTPDQKAMRQRIAQAAKQFSQLDPKEALANAVAMKALPQGLEHLPVNFSAPLVFPAVIAALWLFCIFKSGHELMPWSKLVSMLVRLREGKVDLRLRYLPSGLPALRGPDIPISHQIILRTVPKRGQLVGYVQILGALRVGGILAETGVAGSLEEHLYVDDIFGATRNRSDEFAIESAIFDSIDWHSVGLGVDAPVDQLKTYVQEAMQPLINRKILREQQLAEEGR